MKKYNITVNGTTYAVEVEEESRVTTAAAPVTPVASAAPIAPVTGGEAITAPMPGTIVDIKVVPGQFVKVGEIVVVLEAMKMENEITALADGVVDKVVVAKGTAVNPGDVLITFK